jgi:cell division control protein 6
LLTSNNNNNFNFNIDKFYKNYLKGPNIFRKRDALDPSYIPEELPHRDKEIRKVAELTACALKGDTPPNFLCYGPTGTGKTATIRYVSQKLAQQAQNTKPWWIYINCSVVSTPYRILAHIYNTISGKERIPPTGLPKDIIFKKLLGLMDQMIGQGICFLVLDEIDMLAEKKGGNEILYDLTRLNENLDLCKTSLIGISNKLKFQENLDPRVVSSLGKDHIVFSIYNAGQLIEILEKRANIAFNDGVLRKGVISLCAAYAAQEHGDARKALQLLKKAGNLAERAQNIEVTEHFVNRAVNELEKDHIVEYIKGMPLQAQIILTAIFLLTKNDPKSLIITGYVNDVYAELINKIPGVKRLTKRRISDYINELVLAGIITANTKSMGHYGRTKIIKLDVDLDLIENVLSEITKIKDVLNNKPSLLQSDKLIFKNNVFRKIV